MNILLYDMGSFTQQDLIYYLQETGHHCKNILYRPTDRYEDAFFEERFRIYINDGNWDCVMSTNFFPIVARICHEEGLKYLSWIYDCPIDTSQIEYYQYDTNYIFHFDKNETSQINAMGVEHCYHLPLAVNTKRLDQITITSADRTQYCADISFIGNFYDSPLEQIRRHITPYDRGYIDSLVRSQLQVYGYNFINELVTKDLLDRINQTMYPNASPDIYLTLDVLTRCISNHVTHVERLTLCELLGKHHKMTYYCANKPDNLTHLKHGGTAYYFTEMPKIFRISKLNLNPTLKGITSGIPLRALDILGSGGVLLSNYQPELAEYFIDGEDVIMYESIDDALCKADFYLRNDTLRQAIAQNGYAKTMKYFNYPDKLQSIFAIAGLV